MNNYKTPYRLFVIIIFTMMNITYAIPALGDDIVKKDGIFYRLLEDNSV